MPCRMRKTGSAVVDYGSARSEVETTLLGRMINTYNILGTISFSKSSKLSIDRVIGEETIRAK